MCIRHTSGRPVRLLKEEKKKVKIVYSTKILKTFHLVEIDDVKEKIDFYFLFSSLLQSESSPRDLTYLIYMMTLHSFINAICI